MFQIKTQNQERQVKVKNTKWKRILQHLEKSNVNDEIQLIVLKQLKNLLNNKATCKSSEIYTNYITSLYNETESKIKKYEINSIKNKEQFVKYIKIYSIIIALIILISVIIAISTNILLLLTFIALIIVPIYKCFKDKCDLSYKNWNLYIYTDNLKDHHNRIFNCNGKITSEQYKIMYFFNNNYKKNIYNKIINKIKSNNVTVSDLDVLKNILIDVLLSRCNNDELFYDIDNDINDESFYDCTEKIIKYLDKLIDNKTEISEEIKNKILFFINNDDDNYTNKIYENFKQVNKYTSKMTLMLQYAIKAKIEDSLSLDNELKQKILEVEKHLNKNAIQTSEDNLGI